MTVADAIAAGIAFVHQELNLFDNLDAAANVFIGREPVTGPLRLVDRRRMAAEAEPLFRRLGADFGPDTPVVAAVARPAAAARDRQGAVARQPRRHHGRADLEPDAVGDGAAAQGHRRPQGLGGQRHLHLAPARRGEDLRRPGRRAARRPDGRAARQGRDHARRDDPADDRPRPAVDLPAAGDGGGRGGAVGRGAADGGLPRAGRRPHRPPRRDPRARRPDRRRADGAGAGGLRRRPRPRRRPSGSTAGRSRSPRRATRSPPGSISCPRTARPAASSSTSPIAENISLPQLRAPRRGRDRQPRPGADARRGRAATARHPRARGRRAGGLALGRQPAEGGAGQVAVDAAEGDHLRRADARDRRRRQAGDLRHAAAARRPGGRHPDDLQRHGGGDRRLRPHRRHARGRDQRHARAERVLRAPGARARRRPAAERRWRKRSDAEEGPRPPRPHPRRRDGRRADQPALRLADQHRQHREPRRAVRASSPSGRASSSSPAASSSRSAR